MLSWQLSIASEQIPVLWSFKRIVMFNTNISQQMWIDIHTFEILSRWIYKKIYKTNKYCHIANIYHDKYQLIKYSYCLWTLTLQLFSRDTDHQQAPQDHQLFNGISVCVCPQENWVCISLSCKECQTHTHTVGKHTNVKNESETLTQRSTDLRSFYD